MRIATSSLVLTGGLGLAGLGAAAVAEAQPIAPPTYHWCPGQGWDPGWGDNWDGGRCHDDFYRDGEPHDQGHWAAPATATTGRAALGTATTGRAALGTATTGRAALRAITADRRQHQVVTPGTLRKPGGTGSP